VGTVRSQTKRATESEVDIEGFGLVTGLTEHFQIVTTSNYRSIANSDTLKFMQHVQGLLIFPVVAW
jgi:hypothetical protein